MKILRWNVRGLGHPRKIRALKMILKVHRPDIVFLSEAKLTSSNVCNILFHFESNLPNYHIVGCSTACGDKDGGLILLWNNDVNLSIFDYNKNCIDCYFLCDSYSNHVTRLSCVYGFLNHVQKHLTCSFIKDINNAQNLKNLIVCGDFNLIFSHLEKEGGTKLTITLYIFLMTL